MINDEESTTESTPLRESHSQGSTWRNLFKKIRILLPYIWPKKSTMLQIRVIFCFILLIGKIFFFKYGFSQILIWFYCRCKSNKCLCPNLFQENS